MLPTNDLVANLAPGSKPKLTMFCQCFGHFDPPFCLKLRVFWPTSTLNLATTRSDFPYPCMIAQGKWDPKNIWGRNYWRCCFYEELRRKEVALMEVP